MRKVAFAEELSCTQLFFCCRLGIVAQGCHLVRKANLCLVLLLSLQAFEPSNLLHWQLGKQTQKSTDIGIGSIAPKLPKVLRRKLVAVQPNSALCRLSHFFA